LIQAALPVAQPVRQTDLTMNLIPILIAQVMRRILNFISRSGPKEILVRFRLLMLACLVALAATACGSERGGGTGTGGDKLAIVATTTQVADFARVIGGDRVQVTSLLKPNVDAHDFEPSPADIDAIATSPILIENGFGLEEWLADTVEASGFKGTQVDAGAGITPIEGSPEQAEAGDEHAEEGDDPHVWQSVANAKVMVGNIQRALAKADTEGASVYKANLDAYTTQLDQLDAEIKRQVATVPAAQRKLVTNHEAFNYYAKAYGFEVVGAIIPSFDSSAELAVKDINELVAKIRSTGVKAVFSESSLPPNTAQTIGEEAGVRVVAGENALYGDSLGPAGSDGATYLDMMRHNTRTIVGNLR
jgi:zinc/manganese transport system substrate-binding protein/manganese/iron transport system substrate-binding protein